MLTVYIKASKHLLDLHVLFSAKQTLSADGNPLPVASLALTMDDEVQYRCAGYIQAEIDRYAEFLDDNADEDDNQKSDADELSEDEDEGNATTKKKEGKAKKTEPRREGQIFFSS